MGRLLFSMDPGIDDVLGEISPFFGIFKHAKSYKPGDLCVCSKDYFQVQYSVYSIKFVGAFSLTVCPGAPKVNFSIGRPPPIAPAPNFIAPPSQPVNFQLSLLQLRLSPSSESYPPTLPPEQTISPLRLKGMFSLFTDQTDHKSI